MADDAGVLQQRVKTLETARDQLSKEWLEVEREKSLLAAAIENLSIGFVAVDDYKNITIKNQAADRILGESKAEQWTVVEIQERLKGAFDLEAAIDTCFQQRLQMEPVDAKFEEKMIRFFISPVVILKKSITVPMVVILIENLSASSSSAQAAQGTS